MANRDWATMDTQTLRDRATAILEHRSYGPDTKNYLHTNVDEVVKLAIEFADVRWGINELTNAIAEVIKPSNTKGSKK